MSALSRGWGSGWPNCPRREIVTITLSIGAKLPVHKELAPLIKFLCERTIELGYKIRRFDTWGFACRAIRGTNRASNHSWGLAVDLNATTNPLAYKLITDIPMEIVTLWEAYGFRWGGRYKRRKDPMHFEFMGTPAQARSFIAMIKNLSKLKDDELAKLSEKDQEWLTEFVKEMKKIKATPTSLQRVLLWFRKSVTQYKI